MMKNLLCIFFTLSVIFSTAGCEAKESNDNVLLGPVYLVIDLDFDGIELIPLEESQVYFDIDRDGKKEHVQWISPDDGFLFTDQSRNFGMTKSKDERIQSGLLNGETDIRYGDKNNDEVYETEDFFNPKYPLQPAPLFISIFKDKNSNGNLKINRNVLACKRDFKVKFEDEGSHFHGEIICPGGKKYPFQSINLQYENIQSKEE
jgi:hypothetical protein